MTPLFQEVFTKRAVDFFVSELREQDFTGLSAYRNGISSTNFACRMYQIYLATNPFELFLTPTESTVERREKESNELEDELEEFLIKHSGKLQGYVFERTQYQTYRLK